MNIEIGSIDDVVLIDSQIPEFANGEPIKSKLEKRLHQTKHLILIARVNGELAGYKMGYELSSSTFYSWLGGVTPMFRRNGVATELRMFQELWAKEAGYCEIAVKSMNRFPAMLNLLISSGYTIYGYEQGSAKANGKVLFFKTLI